MNRHSRFRLHLRTIRDINAHIILPLPRVACLRIDRLPYFWSRREDYRNPIDRTSRVADGERLVERHLARWRLDADEQRRATTRRDELTREDARLERQRKRSLL